MGSNNKSVKIRILIGSLDVGGTETHLVRLLPELVVSGIEPVIITLTHKGFLAVELEKLNISVFSPPMIIRVLQRFPLISRLTAPLGTLLYLSFVFKRYSADISCFYLPTSYYLGMLAHMLTVDKSRTIMFRRSLNDYQRDRFFIKLFEKWLHKRVDMIVGNSQAVISQLLATEDASPDKLRLIYNGIKYPQNNATVHDVPLIRQELGIDDATLVMTIVANLIPYKGHVDLILALSQIKEKLPDPWLLLMVGNGLERRPDIIQQIEINNLAGNVVCLGQRSDIEQIYLQTDIGLLVSHQESFSNAVIEGMAAGVPMVVTDVGGNKEAIIHGQCGLVVKPCAPNEIASAILKLANNKVLRDQYGKNARSRVMEKFSSETTLENYQDLFGTKKVREI